MSRKELLVIHHLVLEFELISHTLNALKLDPDYQPFVFAKKNHENQPTFDGQGLIYWCINHECKVFTCTDCQDWTEWFTNIRSHLGWTHPWSNTIPDQRPDYCAGVMGVILITNPNTT